MTWSYDTTLPDAENRVRFVMDDTDENDALFSDEEIAAILTREPYRVFRGRMDVMEINETGASCDITLACEHMLIDLDKPRLRYYTSADQAIDFPSDKGLDMVPALQDAAIKWGG